MVILILESGQVRSSKNEQYTPQEIKKEFFKSKMGIAGITILSILILTSINYNNHNSSRNISRVE